MKVTVKRAGKARSWGCEDFGGRVRSSFSHEKLSLKDFSEEVKCTAVYHRKLVGPSVEETCWGRKQSSQYHQE